MNVISAQIATAPNNDLLWSKKCRSHKNEYLALTDHRDSARSPAVTKQRGGGERMTGRFMGTVVLTLVGLAAGAAGGLGL